MSNRVNIPDYRPDTRKALPPPHQRKLMPLPDTIRAAIEATASEVASKSREARLQSLRSLLEIAKTIELPHG